MAYTNNRNVIPLGDQNGSKQSIVEIPAQAATDKPGVLSLVAVADNGTRTPYYLWVDSTGQLRIHTSIPTNQDSDGSTVTSGASTTLNNLGTTALNAALIPADGTIDLGTDAKPFRTEHLLTSLILNQTTGNYTLTWDNPGAARAISIPDPGATATIMLDAGAANVIAYTKGTSTIAMAANSDIDMATGVTMNLDTNLTVNTEAVTLNQSLSTTDAVAFATGSTIGNLTLANGSITDSGGAISFGNENLTTTGTINIAADSVKMTWGADGATDAYIQFDGSNLKLYDSSLGAARSLTELYSGTTLNPSVSGDLAVPDGKFTWNNATAEASGVWSFAGTSTTDIAISSSVTSGKVLSITADGTANGTLVYLDADGGVGASGYYIFAGDGGTGEFTVGNGGALIMSSVSDIANKIARNNATGTAPVLEIEETHTTGGTTLLIDSKCTDGNDALQITHAGTGYGLSIIGTATTGKQALFQGPASQTTSSVVVDGTTNSWIGAAGVGMLHLSSDGALANAGSSLLYSTYTGAIGAIVSSGTCAQFVDAGNAAATSAYTVGISSTNNNGLNVVTSATGKTAITASGVQATTVPIVKVDGTTGTGWVGAATTGMVNLETDGTLANATASLLRINHSGTMAAAAKGGSLLVADTSTAVADTYPVWIGSTNNNLLCLEGTAVAKNQLTITGPASQTAAMVKVTSTFIGAADTGALDITGTGNLANAAASQVRITSSGTIQANSEGVCLNIEETGAANATSYAVRIDSTSNEALHVATGKSLFDELATFTVGTMSTPYAITATDTGDTTGTIPAGYNYCTVNCDGDANHIVILPAPVVGQTIKIYVGATGCELRSSDPATVAINGGTGVNAESAIAANTLVTATCTTTTTWVCMSQVADGTVSATQIAA